MLIRPALQHSSLCYFMKINDTTIFYLIGSSVLGLRFAGVIIFSTSVRWSRFVFLYVEAHQPGKRVVDALHNPPTSPTFIRTQPYGRIFLTRVTASITPKTKSFSVSHQRSHIRGVHFYFAINILSFQMIMTLRSSSTLDRRRIIIKR